MIHVQNSDTICFDRGHGSGTEISSASLNRTWAHLKASLEMLEELLKDCHCYYHLYLFAGLRLLWLDAAMEHVDIQPHILEPEWDIEEEPGVHPLLKPHSCVPLFRHSLQNGALFICIMSFFDPNRLASFTSQPPFYGPSFVYIHDFLILSCTQVVMVYTGRHASPEGPRVLWTLTAVMNPGHIHTAENINPSNPAWSLFIRCASSASF